MKMRYFIALLAVISCLDAQATSYNANLSQGVKWLTGQQNNDGSWGANPNLQPVYTSAAVQALARAYNTDAAYYAGVTWLEDHAINNVDLTSRSAEALISHGDSLGAALTYLNNDQYVNSGTYAGWGLNGNYTSSTLDTALALIAIKDLGTDANLAAAVTFLQNQQGTTAGNQGWTINSSSNTSSDPAVTAIVIQALARFTGTYSALSTNIANGLTTLNSQLNSASPPIQLALAAQAAQDAGDTAKATTFLNYLVASQSTTDGSWNQDPYITAVATRAIATNVQAAAQSTIVPITDQNLQAAINKALGRNAMDSLNLGLLAQLTTLNAAGDGISNLSGLQNAVNLKTINLNNNNLANISAISSLTGATVTWYDNPGNPSNPPGTQVPAMPPLAMLILAAGLFSMMQFFNRKPVSGKAGQLFGLLVMCLLMVSGNNTYAQTVTSNGNNSLPAPATTLPELRAKGLPAEKLQIIQQIGGNVLQAKRTATVEPGDKDVLNQVQATVANLLKIEKQGVGNIGLSANAQSQQEGALKKAQSAAWEVVTTLRQESSLLQGSGKKLPKKQILSGGKHVGEQRGRLYVLWANQLDNILGNQDTSARLKQLTDLNNQLLPVTSISKRLDNPGSTPKMHLNSRL
ncbi:prenyltransferase/squalene oxidase repeat-containing protein [Methylomonas sp. AM2-LC]|uniref:prenyltransferase/squalene oxidase repeat-containing protein n=1 Tax=Methylomonas sp. AM2-LC TaxID=3153301 RepID=UPI003265945C